MLSSAFQIREAKKLDPIWHRFREGGVEGETTQMKPSHTPGGHKNHP